jgi:hypothetical protein
VERPYRKCNRSSGWNNHRRIRSVYGGVVQQFQISISSTGSVSYTAEYLDWLGYDENPVWVTSVEALYDGCLRFEKKLPPGH